MHSESARTNVNLSRVADMSRRPATGCSAGCPARKQVRGRAAGAVAATGQQPADTAPDRSGIPQCADHGRASTDTNTSSSSSSGSNGVPLARTGAHHQPAEHEIMHAWRSTLLGKLHSSNAPSPAWRAQYLRIRAAQARRSQFERGGASLLGCASSATGRRSGDGGGGAAVQVPLPPSTGDGPAGLQRLGQSSDEDEELYAAILGKDGFAAPQGRVLGSPWAGSPPTDTMMDTAGADPAKAAVLLSLRGGSALTKPDRDIVGHGEPGANSEPRAGEVSRAS
eukprot:SAG22_NODE_696_length_7828_cov_35.057964_5_plen_281_part_00